MKLAADVGGTRARFLAEAGRRAELPCASFDSFDDLVAAGLAELDLAAEPVDAAFAIAGPVHGERAAFTNLSWHADRARLRARFGFRRVELRNDLECAALEAAYALPPDTHDVQAGTCAPDARRVLIGVGTGLGVAYWRGPDAEASEAGHVGFPAESDWQRELAARIRERHGRVSWERVASGMALVALDALERDAPLESAAAVVERAHRGDDAAGLALTRLSALLGAFAGDLVLAGPGIGAVLLAGGVLARLDDAFDANAFRQAFADKGRFHESLSRIPVWRTADEDLALRGAMRCI